jgi:aminopeptidase N
MLDISGDVAPVRLAEYRPPDFLIDTVDLVFELGDSDTRVKSRLRIRRNPESSDQTAALHLDGEELALVSLALDGEPLGPNRYELPAEGGLIVADVPDAFSLDIETGISPKTNTALSGLYMSGGNFCTQCEPEGFRRITYFVDRPDVMARYTTTIIADKGRFPVLLSNGNPVESGEDGDRRHWAKWVDPHPKPSYLFALVAGDLVAVPDRFTTRSGKEVALAIWVRRGDEDKCGHAMASLKKAMRWDEDVFGLEYDLDVFNIVAVSDFNMGAMENKGLNIFNTRYVLAKPDTATDTDYQNIEAVIAHEYFHNWTGNRVTCRDWFQLSLKEGLTVFRDQEFSADQGSRAVRRIAEVRTLRAVQFPEDDGPLAHPVRPDSYIRIDNFYTPTVYNKGAELVRMIHTLIGKEGFRRGMDLYIRRHDNHAATIEDFVAAMQDAGGLDLGQFKRWYEQAGTPEITIEDRWDASARSYELTAQQRVPPTPGQPDKLPMLIPLAMGLIGPDWDACSSVRRCASEFSLCRRAGAPRAVAAARFLGPRQAEGRAARPAKVSCRARHRALCPLGSRPAGCGQNSARPDCRSSARRGPPTARPGRYRSDAAHPHGCRPRSGLRCRGSDLAERGFSRRSACRRRCRRHSRGPRRRPRGALCRLGGGICRGLPRSRRRGSL